MVGVVVWLFDIGEKGGMGEIGAKVHEYPSASVESQRETAGVERSV
jgi:hypothetical protein